MKTRKIPDESHYPMGYLNGTDVAGRPTVELDVALEQIQDAGVEQLALVQPGASLPEWRVGWLEEGTRLWPAGEEVEVWGGAGSPGAALMLCRECLPVAGCRRLTMVILLRSGLGRADSLPLASPSPTKIASEYHSWCDGWAK